MSHQIDPDANPQLDAFSRLRVSSPTAIFDNQFEYGLQPLLWESVVTGAGSVLADSNTSSIKLTVSASGAHVIRQSHRYFRYQCGKSQLISLTAVMGALKGNTRQRVGYFDGQNGLFFEQDGTHLRVVQRSFTSGVAVDTAVNQADWNLDTLSGESPSVAQIDTSKSQIFVIDLQWLGVGRVRFGVDFGGQIVYCHQFINANLIPTVYMTTANLPARYELEMTGPATPTVMNQICQSVISEGGFEDERGLLFTANNGIDPVKVASRRPILSIRPKTTFAGVPNRGLIAPLDVAVKIVEVEVGVGDALVELVLNGKISNPNFVSVDPNSLTEFDTQADDISPGTGTVILSFYVSLGDGSARTVPNTLGSLVGLSLNVAGTSGDVFSVVVSSFAGTDKAVSVLGWKEIY